MTTDQRISQLVAALRGMTPTQHTSSCMKHEGGVVDGPDGWRVGVGPLVVGTCQCPERVQVARAALDAAALDEQEPDAFRRFRHCLEFDEDAPIEAVIEAAIQRLDYDLHLVGENARAGRCATDVRTARGAVVAATPPTRLSTGPSTGARPASNAKPNVKRAP